MSNPKTADQLKREIAYFEWLKARTRSRDRQRRAARAITKRQAQLAVHDSSASLRVRAVFRAPDR